jgi:uncharacterized membrane protein YecN with MAPEG domain
MPAVVLLVFAFLAVWMLVAIGIALLAGGVIHARDHRDLRLGPVPARTVVRLSVAGPGR